MHEPVLDWLLEGDASIRWQVERDLLGLPSETWEATRQGVSTSGWGRELLDLQDPKGTWGNGIYGPKWIGTTYTLLLLCRFGLPEGHPQALAGIDRLLEASHEADGGLTLWDNHEYAEKCVNGMLLALTAYFGIDDPRVDSIAEYLVSDPMADGAWNCRDFQGATHSSFHTTINVLEGLLMWKERTGSTDADTAIARGHEFMFDHRMFRSHRTGEVINRDWLTPHFPPRWHYDVLRGLDHLRAADAERDPRVAGAIEQLVAKRRSDGRWGKGSQYSGQSFFVMEPGRVPGRWNTLRALRVLDWWASPSTSGRLNSSC